MINKILERYLHTGQTVEISDAVLSKDAGCLYLTGTSNFTPDSAWEESIRREGSVNNSKVLSIDELKLDSFAHEVWLGGRSVSLTLKEYSILQKLLSAPGRVFTREQMLDDIWGFDFEGDVRTVDSHVARLRTKLGDWGVNHIKTIYGTGYKLEVTRDAAQ